MQHKIVLVDDHPVFREGLNHLLAKEKDLRVVGEAGDGQMAIEMVLQKKPDLVVMDINMPNLDGIEATRRLLSEAPETRVVALSVHSGKQFIRDMIEAGALGYILKESIPEEMVEGIRTVLTGNVYLSKTISNALVLDYKDLVSDAQPGSDAPVFSVLYTKLYPPTITADIVPRVHLVELLEKGAQYPMSLIVGPAGYGKSILASQWLEVTELPSGWVSLDEGDNDLSVFLSYVVEAIQTIFPGHELQTKPLLGISNLPSSKVIARYLLNDLETLPERFILVVDDYQFIRKAAIHDLLMELLVHPSPRIHLVLISRRDPPLPLTSLRGRGMLTEISVQKLRFSALETRSYLGRFLQIAISDQTAQVLEEKVEGWVTGLHLAALSIRNEADQERVTAGLLETSQYVSDYLVEEALSQVPVEFEVYLLATAISRSFPRVSLRCHCTQGRGGTSSRRSRGKWSNIHRMAE